MALAQIDDAACLAQERRVARPALRTSLLLLERATASERPPPPCRVAPGRVGLELRFESRKEDELVQDAPPRLEARCETGGELLERYDERLRGVLRCELLPGN